MEGIKKRYRKKSRRSGKRRKFWKRLLLYFIYFSIIFLSLYFLFDKKDMLNEIHKEPQTFYWKVFGASFAFALGLALWMRRDPKLKEK
jgi:polyferredoxin